MEVCRKMRKYFFFSSRRRHTRCGRDWSSDVCSSDLEFRIHPRTLEAAKANAQGLAQLSAERVRDEWFKGLKTAKKMSRLVTLWRDVGATRIWLPEMGAGSGELGAVDKLPPDPVLVTAYLA